MSLTCCFGAVIMRTLSINKDNGMAIGEVVVELCACMICKQGTDCLCDSVIEVIK